ncbi:hypothetical protein TWF191_002276 [Orbilia oligospora]|uniref:Zn(2)-C6 fungal-type domain-containing protein n=1 Tax=Orbilia oligospora TaxID=2813651 RepID=A0A7C8U8H6_ORBOL|nr:hypothetical protein TWF191_002276 [Orbilia oligospora]
MDRPKSKPKSRACVGCRSMKIKCVPVPKSSKCEACLRLVRPCEAPGPIKPRIKQAQRFQELERKIEILTSALQPERAGPDPSFVQNQNVPVEDGSGYSGGLATRNQYSQAPVSPSAIIGTGDVIDQGVIDISTASNLLNYWKENIRPIFPIIQFSADQDVHSIRRDTPVLFLTILTISSASIDPTFLDRLLPRLNNLFAQEVFVLGNRSIDLLQALIFFSQYHIQPPEAKTFPLTQHVYNAMAMASDLMLEEKVKATANKPNENTLEACRILLGIYFAASASSTLLRRSQFNFFQPNYQKYAKILMDTDSSNLDDLWLCKIVELQQISEDASLSLNQPYNVEADSFEDSKTRSLFNLLQHRLSEWDKDNSGLVDSRLSTIAKLSIELQTNQVGIRGFNHKMGLEYKSSYREGRAIQNPSITASSVANLLGAVHQRLAVHSQNGCLPQAKPFETIFLKLKTWHVQKKSFCINLHGGCKEPAGPIHDILSGEIVDETGQKISTHANTNTFAPAETMQAHEQYGINQPLGLTPPLTIDDNDMVPEEYENQDFSNNQPVYDPFGAMDPDSEGGMQFSVEEMQDFDMSMTYNNYFWMLPFLK